MHQDCVLLDVVSPTFVKYEDIWMKSESKKMKKMENDVVKDVSKVCKTSLRKTKVMKNGVTERGTPRHVKHECQTIW